MLADLVVVDFVFSVVVGSSNGTALVVVLILRVVVEGVSVFCDSVVTGDV